MGVISIDKLLVKLDFQISNAKNKIDSVDKKLKGVNKTIKKTQVDTRGFIRQLQAAMLQVGLSFLFTGMAIQRFFQGMLQSLFQTFLLAEGEQGIMNEKLNQLKGLLEFVKFSFVDAFVNTGLADKWIDRIETLIKNFNSLTDEQKSSAIEFAVLGAAAGGFLMVIGQIGLGILGLVSLFSFLALNPIVLLIAGLVLVGIVMALLIKKVGGFGNLFKATLRGIVNLSALSAQLFINFWVDALQALLRIINRMLLALPESIRPSRLIEGLGGIGLRAPDIVGQASAFKQFLNIPNVDNPQQKTTVNVNVEGSVISENDLIQFIFDQVNNRLSFNNGSPQG